MDVEIQGGFREALPHLMGGTAGCAIRRSAASRELLPRSLPVSRFRYTGEPAVAPGLLSDNRRSLWACPRPTCACTQAGRGQAHKDRRLSLNKPETTAGSPV